MMIKRASYTNPTLDVAIDKIWKRLVPLMFVLYFFAFINRVNIGFAQDVMQANIGLSDGAYAFGASIFFVAYAIFGVPSNLLLNKFGARKWLGITSILWGGVAVATAFVQNNIEFIILRFLLGMTEAGFYPGILLLASIYFPNKVKGSVIATFILCVPLALSIGSPLSGALIQMHLLGLQGWSWMFIVEGGIGAILGAFALYYLDDSPSSARFLTQEEKDILNKKLQQEEQVTQTSSIFLAFKNLNIWCLAIIYGFIQVAVYGLMFFLPSQVASLIGSQTGFEASLIAAIPWICSGFGVYYIPRIADHYTNHRITIAALCMVLAGFGLFFSTISNPLIAIIALSCSAIGFLSVQPIFWILPSQILSGPALAAGIGFCTTIGGVGSFIAPNLRVQIDLLMHNNYAGLYTLSIIAFFCAFLILMLSYASKHNYKTIEA